MNANSSEFDLLKDEGCSAVARSSDGADGWARSCDSCCSAPCAVYCRADAAYLCAGCDSQVHAANRFAQRHERVWVCEACKQVPAELTCQADAAALCANCDADIHSANQLASRHHRVPILPLPAGCLHSSSMISNPFLGVDDGVEDQDEEEVDLNVEDEVSSWFLSDGKDYNQYDDSLFFSEEVDEYLNLVESPTDKNQPEDDDQWQQQQQQQQKLEIHHEKNEVSECVVPSHSVTVDEEWQQQGSCKLTNMEYNDVSNTGFVRPHRHSVSLTSIYASIVPDTTMTDISNSHLTTSKGSTDLFLSLSLQLTTQPAQTDREAKVLRYWQKKKMRKFEKTIRYESRKAYAETRPRIKGRFAKRTDCELEAAQIFSSFVLSEGSCGVVPSV